MKSDNSDDTSITKNFASILKSFRSWIPGATHSRFDQNGTNDSSEEETREERRENRRQSFRNRRSIRQRSTRRNKSQRGSIQSDRNANSISSSRTSQKSQSKNRFGKQLPNVPKDVIDPIPPTIQENQENIQPEPNQSKLDIQPIPKPRIKSEKPIKPERANKNSKLKSPRKSPKSENPEKSGKDEKDKIPPPRPAKLPQLLETTAKSFSSLSIDRVTYDAQEPETKSKSGSKATPGLELERQFSQQDLAEAEQLFKQDEKFASLFEACVSDTDSVTTIETDSEKTIPTEDSSRPPSRTPTPRRSDLIASKAMSSIWRDTDYGVKVNRNSKKTNKTEEEDGGDSNEELTILPMEVEIIETEQESQQSRSHKRIKCNSAGQEPPKVPPKPSYLRTISVTSLSNASSVENLSRNTNSMPSPYLPSQTSSNSTLQPYRHTYTSQTSIESSKEKRAHTWSMSSVASDTSELLREGKSS